MAYAHRHTLVKHVKREHQRSVPRDGVNIVKRDANGEHGGGVKPSASKSQRGHGSGTGRVPVESASGLAGALEHFGGATVDDEAEDFFRRHPVTRPAASCLKTSIEASDGTQLPSSVSNTTAG